MPDGDAGGSGNTGQTTLGDEQRKLEPSEAGFRDGEGIPGLQCGDCFFFESETCRIVNVSPNPGDTCGEFEPDRRGKMTSVQSPEAAVRRFDEFGDYPLTYIKRRKFDKKTRMKLAKSGSALPHGGFPITSCGDVKNAIGAVGRAKDRAATIAHIKKRHAALSCKTKLPVSWKSMAPVEYAVSGPMRRIVPVLRTKHLLITKVAQDKQTGERRWYARASGVERDLYNERMSVNLFADFIKRAEGRDEVPVPFSSEAWNGGLPYLGVAHYLDLGGKGIVGPTEQLWQDGNLLKARGTFRDTPMAKAAFKSIQEDIKNKTPLEERVRISIAFIDWAHDHEGAGNFERKSLTDRCDMCASGKGEKVYKAGHLVHLALTRIPAYPTATIELEEKSMGKSKRYDDAESIVGKYADELEEEDKLVGRSGEDISEAVVIRQDEEEGEFPPRKKKKKKKRRPPPREGEEEEGPPPEEEDEGPPRGRRRRPPPEEGEEEEGPPPEEDEGPPPEEGEEEEGEFEEGEEEDEEAPRRKKKGRPPFGGAKSLADAEDYIVRTAGNSPVLMDSMNVVAGVLTNVAGAEHESEIREILGDFQTRLDSEVLRALSDVRKSLPKEATMPKDSEVQPEAAVAEAEAAPAAADAEVLPEAEVQEEDEVGLAVASLIASYNEAIETPADEAVRLRMIQEPFEKVAKAMKANIGGESAEEAPQTGGVTIEQIQQAVATEVAPLAAEVEKLKTASTASEEDGPVRRAVQSGSLFMAQKSGVTEPGEVITESDVKNPKTDKNVTPGLRSLVRQTVGLKR